MATLDCSFIIVEEKHGNTGIELTPNYKRRSPVITRGTRAPFLLFFTVFSDIRLSAKCVQQKNRNGTIRKLTSRYGFVSGNIAYKSGQTVFSSADEFPFMRPDNRK